MLSFFQIVMNRTSLMKIFISIWKKWTNQNLDPYFYRVFEKKCSETADDTFVFSPSDNLFSLSQSKLTIWNTKTNIYKDKVKLSSLFKINIVPVIW